ncbi:GlxA family transcriptional regulator [Cochlodiniinecator piscidefendens]|uniref:GlxA family transcriptional regulator n=1 Tax=Cochlodiniinecator piscidefendens TaxID=2715756 RepID=UPI001407D571|nr:helix-turn-helix domain-containing protein [Cochlodiniinecator piscidefendens]
MNRLPESPEVSFGIAITHTFPILALSGFVDTLRHAADDDNQNRQIYCRWEICGSDANPVMSSAGINIHPDVTFGEMAAPDYFVMIGGLMPHIDRVPTATLRYMRKYHADGGTVVGLCTGSFILAQAGLLTGRRAVVHHRHRRDFVSRYKNIQVSSRDIFVEDDRVITCPGGTASIDLAMTLLSRKLGRQRALKGLVEMSVDRFRASTEMALTPLTKFENCNDKRVVMAIEIMRENLSLPMSLREISEGIGISTSQLTRLFVHHTKLTPAKFRRSLQLEHARWMLLNSSKSMTQIAMDTGFTDHPHFTKVFLKAYHMSPKTYQKQRLSKSVLDG